MAKFRYNRTSASQVEIILDNGQTICANREVILNALRMAEEDGDFFKDARTLADYKAMYQGALKELDKPMKSPDYKSGQASLFASHARS